MLTFNFLVDTLLELQAAKKIEKYKNFIITKHKVNVYVHTMVEPPLPISNREVKHHLAELVLR